MMAGKFFIFFVAVLSVTTADSIIPNISSLKNVFGAITNVSQGVIDTATDVISFEETQLLSHLKLDLDDLLRKALVKIKDLMHDKIELLNLPKLEPCEIDHVDFDLSHEIGIFKGTLDNVLITNLSKFETENILVNGTLPWDVIFTLKFNNLDILGDYELDAVVGDLFNVYGQGDFNIILNNLDVTVSIKKINLKGIHLKFEDIDIKVKLGEMKARFGNLMGGGENEELFNKIIGELGPEAVDEVWPDAEPEVSKIVAEEANYRLSQVTIFQLLKLIEG